MKTYDRAAFLKARDQWERGRFSWRWQGIRRIAAERGFIFPPEGSVHDDRDADPPSQRAIIYSALEDNPTRVEAIVRRSNSWYEVVNGIIGMEARLAAEADERERDDRWERKDEPEPRAATLALGNIIRRIGDSL